MGEVEQGQMVALIGPKGEGKSTILKILGGVILPKPGGLFAPSHLRVLHVSSEALFFMGTLYENLTFGCNKDDADGSMDRVIEICQELGITKSLQEIVKQGADGSVKTWSEVLSLTQRSLCNLARALIANPEMLCIHKPTMSFDEPTSRTVLQYLRKYT